MGVGDVADDGEERGVSECSACSHEVGCDGPGGGGVDGGDETDACGWYAPVEPSSHPGADDERRNHPDPIVGRAPLSSATGL